MSVTPADLAATLLRRAAARRVEDADDGERCRREVLTLLPVLRRELGFRRAWLVGTLAWGGFGVRSDIDVVVEATDAEAAHVIAERLGDATGREVDVLVLDTLPPSFQDRIVKDGLDVP
jgi:predicted nucleotidyltransferase